LGLSAILQCFAVLKNRLADGRKLGTKRLEMTDIRQRNDSRRAKSVPESRLIRREILALNNYPALR
jgi:hypothetical protein